MINTKNYLFCNEMKKMSLDSLYSNDQETLEALKYNLEAIITTEAPLTMNTLKQRLREAFEIKKISQKALDIIEDQIKILGFPITDNLYDKVLWPTDGIFTPIFLRINSNRQIYDIPNQELILLARSLNKHGEELYRAILSYFGYEVLTEKARNYLEYIEGLL